MNKYSKSKVVKIKDREFSIRKFDARTGSFMLVKVTGLLGPMFKNLDLNKFKKSEGSEDQNDDIKLTDIDISGAISVLSNLSEQDFNYIQEKCLRVCAEMLPSGPANVLSENGTFGVIGLEDDTMTVMALTAHALIFNVMSFFGDSPLASMAGAALSSIQSIVRT